jgi:4-hydroxy-tetrahydrodipicolinate synthase
MPIALDSVTVATVLPFLPDGGIDWDSYRRLLDYCATPDGVKAVFVNGHAGEAAALAPDECAEVIRVTRAHLGRDRTLMAGIVAYSTAAAIARTREARDAGADVAVLFPFPQYGAGGGADRRAGPAYVAAVHDAVPMPLSIFQYPLASGAGFSTEVLTEIARHPGVVAIKEGSGTVEAYEDNWRAIKAARPAVRILPSNFGWFLPQVAIGADGILSGLASLAPRELVALWRAAEAGDLAAMRAASDRLYPIVRGIYGAPPLMDMHTRIKAALNALGVIAHDHPRPPLMPLLPEVRDRVVALAARVARDG